jgi:indolepyruvate decarboxylase
MARQTGACVVNDLDGDGMTTRIAEYLLKRLQEQNVDTLFGVPAVYCAELFATAARLNMKIVVTASDIEAGYAADGYARRKGLGAASVSYGVGTLSLANAIAGAYAERSPVVVINGGPNQSSIDELNSYGILFSHSIGNAHTDLDVFKSITAFAHRVTSGARAPSEIDNALSVALSHKRPVYLEVPMGMWSSQCMDPAHPLDPGRTPSGNERAIASNILARMRTAVSPLLMLGIELQRYGLADAAAKLVGTLSAKFPTKLKWASTLLAKSIVPETQNPQQFAGVFADHCTQMLANLISSSDLIVALGCVFGSGHSALMRPAFDRNVVVHALEGKVRSFGAAAQKADIVTLVSDLSSMALTIADTDIVVQSGPLDRIGADLFPGDEECNDHANASAVASTVPVPIGLNYGQLFDGISNSGFLDGTWLIIPDTFLGEYAAARLKLQGRDTFLTSAIWASIGHSVGAAVGAAMGTAMRVLAICGDGGFQIMAPALSTMVRQAQRTVVIVVDNGMYGIEQFLRDKSFYSSNADPLPYVTLNRWDYTKLATALGFTFAASADSPATLAAALLGAKGVASGPAFIQAVVKSRSLPPQL